MYRTIATIFLVLIWLSQFYSVVSLVVWINRGAAAPRPSRGRIKTAMTVQIAILAAIVAFFAVDYLRNHLAGGAGPAPSLRYYLANGAAYLIIPGILWLLLLRIKKQRKQI